MSPLEIHCSRLLAAEAKQRVAEANPEAFAAAAKVSCFHGILLAKPGKRKRRL